MSGENNPMYGRSGKNSPAFKGNIYQLDLDGKIIDIFESSCLAAEKILGYKIERGTKNAKGLCGRILSCCNNWSILKKNPNTSMYFTAMGFQWIRENDYFLLQNANYDFSQKRTAHHNAFPITELGLDNDGALN